MHCRACKGMIEENFGVYQWPGCSIKICDEYMEELEWTKWGAARKGQPGSARPNITRKPKASRTSRCEELVFSLKRRAALLDKG